jgi:hypothetical protein
MRSEIAIKAGSVISNGDQAAGSGDPERRQQFAENIR